MPYLVCRKDDMRNKKKSKKTNENLNAKQLKRIGVAEQEMVGFDLTLEDFNNIGIGSFEGHE
jgi:hypothetical protein